MRHLCLIFWLLFLGGGNLLSLTAQTPTTAQRWAVIDLAFSATEAVAAPWSVAFGATFTPVSGQPMRVPGFYDGNNRWVLRFCPPQTGQWRFETYASLPSLAGKTGRLYVSPAEKADEHGPLVISPAHPQRFAYADGTPYFLMAFECDWLFALDAQNESGIPRTQQMVGHIKRHGFNHVVINVYAYDAGWGDKASILPRHNFARPEVFPFGGTNEAPDYSTLNLAFFQHLDRVVAHLEEEEIIAHLMIYVWNKQVNWPEPGSEADNRYFDYVVKRYQAFPNLVWDISKEALAYGRDDMSYITRRIHRLRRLDGHGRLLSVHDYNYCRAFPGEVDFISIQEWSPNLYDAMRRVAERHEQKPIFNIEHGGYEESRHPIFRGAYTDPELCLHRNYLCAFAGTYSTYYWQNTAWYEVVYDLETLPEAEQPKLSWYQHFVELFSRYDFRQFEPIQHAFNTYGLTDGGSNYLFYVPDGMHMLAGDMPELKEQTVEIQWFDPLSGQYYSGGTKSFAQGIWLGIKRPESLLTGPAVAILSVVEVKMQEE